MASIYAANRLWQEALDAYGALLKSKAAPQQGVSLRVNIGNVHFEQGRMPPAIKAYRMALDALPPAAGRQRAALLRNIGLAFVRMGQYADAASAYEAALAAAPEHLVRWLPRMQPFAGSDCLPGVRVASCFKHPNS